MWTMVEDADPEPNTVRVRKFQIGVFDMAFLRSMYFHVFKMAIVEFLVVELRIIHSLIVTGMT